MASPNLQITDIIFNDDNKEVIHNAAIASLDDASNSHATKAITGNTSLTSAETTGNFYIELTGTFGAFTLDMPDTNKRFMCIENNTTGICTLRNSASSGTITIAVDDLMLFFYDGTTILEITAMAVP